MWRQGEHVAVIGMNGSGKTTLERTLLEKRKWRVMLVSKPDDLVWKGWTTVTRAKDVNPLRGTSYRLQPPLESARTEFRECLNKVWHQGSWCVVLDELYFLQYLGLERDVVKLLTQGRSKHITVVAGVQRPYQVTRFALSEPVHVFAFTLGDRRDLRALAEGVSDAYAREVSKLKQYEVAYIDKRSRKTQIATSRDLQGIME